MFNRCSTASRARYDAANRVMSGGIDVVWRKKAIARLLEGLGETPRILDLGAGTLDGALEIARRAPGARVAAADFAREMLRAGREKLQPGAAIDTHAADGHDLPYRDAAFDGAFSAFCVRNLRDLPRGLARAAPGGAAWRARGDPRVPAPREDALLLRPHLEPPRAAAARLGRHRRPRRLPLPARFDRRFSFDGGVRGA